METMRKDDWSENIEMFCICNMDSDTAVVDVPSGKYIINRKDNTVHDIV